MHLRALSVRSIAAAEPRVPSSTSHAPLPPRSAGGLCAAGCALVLLCCSFGGLRALCSGGIAPHLL